LNTPVYWSKNVNTYDVSVCSINSQQVLISDIVFIAQLDLEFCSVMSWNWTDLYPRDTRWDCQGGYENFGIFRGDAQLWTCGEWKSRRQSASATGSPEKLPL